MTASTTITAGPNKIAPRPIPVGCEQLPVTEGIFSEDSTKVKAPAKASKNISLAFSLTTRLMALILNMANGKAAINHKEAHFTGKNPSAICIPTIIQPVFTNKPPFSVINKKPSLTAKKPSIVSDQRHPQDKY
jgi:hypothetical protein